LTFWQTLHSSFSSISKKFFLWENIILGGMTKTRKNKKQTKNQSFRCCDFWTQEFSVTRKGWKPFTGSKTAEFLFLMFVVPKKSKTKHEI
jgi:hypothetical protein